MSVMKPATDPEGDKNIHFSYFMEINISAQFKRVYSFVTFTRLISEMGI